MNWKIVFKVLPNGPASDPVGPPASLLGGTPVKVKPCQIRDVEEPIVVHDQEQKDSDAHLRCKKGRPKASGSVGTCSPLSNQWPVQGDLTQTKGVKLSLSSSG